MVKSHKIYLENNAVQIDSASEPSLHIAPDVDGSPECEYKWIRLIRGFIDGREFQSYKRHLRSRPNNSSRAFHRRGLLSMRLRDAPHHDRGILIYSCIICQYYYSLLLQYVSINIIICPVCSCTYAFFYQ